MTFFRGGRENPSPNECKGTEDSPDALFVGPVRERQKDCHRSSLVPVSPRGHFKQSPSARRIGGRLLKGPFSGFHPLFIGASDEITRSRFCCDDRHGVDWVAGGKPGRHGGDSSPEGHAGVTGIDPHADGVWFGDDRH